MFSSGYNPTPNNVNYNKFGAVSSGLVKLAVSTDSEYRIPEYTPISNQGSLSSCVANATADAAELLLGVNQQQVVQLSRLFLYWNARVYDKTTRQNVGTYIHNAFNSLSTLGICPEDLWPYVESAVYTQPPIKAYKSANDNKIDSYYRIDSSGQQRCVDVEAAVRSNLPVVFGTGISDEFTKAWGVDKVWTAPQNSIGGHAMIITGVRRNPNLEFYVRNSWSESWGDGTGHAWFDASYIAWSGTSDLWVPTLVSDII